LFVGLVLPAVIQSQVPQRLGEWLGREVTISDVKINPFFLRVQINELVLSEQNGSSEFVRVKRLSTELNFWQSVMQLTPTLEYFVIQEPRVSIIRLNSKETKETFNFSRLLERLTASQTEQSDRQSTSDVDELKSNDSAEIEKRVAFKVHDMRLLQGVLSFRDMKTAVTLGYQNINVHLSDLDTRSVALMKPQDIDLEQGTVQSNAIANRYQFSMNGQDGSQVKLNGQFQLQPFEMAGNLRLSELKLAPFWPFSENLIQAELTQGNMSLSSYFHIAQGRDDQVSVRTNQERFSLKGIEFIHENEANIKLEKLTIAGIALNSAQNNIDLGNLHVSGLWVNGEFNANGFNLQRYFTPKLEMTGSEIKVDRAASEKKVKGKAWRVKLNSFTMNDTDLHLKESVASNGVHWRVYPLNINTGKVSSDFRQPIDYDLEFGISSSKSSQPKRSRGKFESRGQFDVNALELNSQLQLTALDLRQFQPYIAPYANIIVNEGSLSTKGSVKANNRGSVIFQGQVAIDQLSIKDVLEKEPVFKWKKMSINSLIFDKSAGYLNIDTVLLNAPYAKVIITKDRQTNIGAMSKVTPSHATQTNQSITKIEIEEKKIKGSVEKNRDTGFDVDISTIKMVGGSAFFADYSLKPNFASGIESLEGVIEHISSKPGTKAKVDIEGKIDKYAPVSLKGEVNPLIQFPYLDLDFSLDSAELTSVNPYSGTYAGYYIDKGQLSLDINYRLENNRLEGRNHVVVDQLTLGKRSESTLATSLPVTLAVGLLQDSDGVIDLGFDVSGNVNSPEFSFGGVILKAVVNIITKAITAPFSLLADLVGSDEELNFVSFKPGVAALDSDGEARLVTLTEALKVRPNLRLSVEGSVLEKEDSRALAEIRLHQKLLENSGLLELPEDLTASRIPISGPLPQALERLFTKELGKEVEQERTNVALRLMESEPTEDVSPKQVTTSFHISLYNQLLNRQDISQYDLASLAEIRARTVKSFLVEHEIEPNRVFILDSKTKLKTKKSQAILTIDFD